MELLCVDTDVLIAYLRGDSEAVELFRRDRERIATTSINVYELLFGPLKAGRRREYHAALDLLTHIKILPLDGEAAATAARADAELHRIGRPVGLRDVLIAAIAHSNGCTVVTGNVRRFRAIADVLPELSVASVGELIREGLGRREGEGPA